MTRSDLLVRGGNPVFLAAGDGRWLGHRSGEPAALAEGASWVARRFEELRRG